MMTPYYVLARKYRPQRFSDLMGQEILVETLTNAIQQKRIPHAILLTGVRGVGKTTSARLIARALNCIGPDGHGHETITPCGVCAPCVEILEDRHLDVVEMDAASRTSVDDIRKIIDAAYYKPATARYKVQIIDEVHMLTKQAFNALLKTLEEPPEYTKFIFATTEIHRIPDTILSRCMRFDLKRLDLTTLRELILKICSLENFTIDSEAATLLAQAADGSARDSQSLLERAITLCAPHITSEAVRKMLGLASQDHLLTLFTAIIQGDAQKALTCFKTAYHQGADPDSILKALNDFVYETLCLKVSPSLKERSLLTKEDLQELQHFADTLSVPVLTRLWQMITKGREELTWAYSAAQAVEMILIRTCYLSDLPTAGAVLQELEKQQPTPLSPVRPLQPSQSSPAPLTQEKTLPKAPKTFKEVVTLFEDHKEPLLKYELENHVSLVSFDPTQHTLVLSLTVEAPPTLLREIKKKLDAWTGGSWTLTEEKTQDHKTLRDQAREEKDQLKYSIKNTPLVKTALETFPDAEIQDISVIKEAS